MKPYDWADFDEVDYIDDEEPFDGFLIERLEHGVWVAEPADAHASGDCLADCGHPDHFLQGEVVDGPLDPYWDFV